MIAGFWERLGMGELRRGGEGVEGVEGVENCRVCDASIDFVDGYKEDNSVTHHL